MATPADLLILSGPPGAGKSTVGRLVARHEPSAVCIEADWFWSTIVSGYVAPWLPESDAQNRTVLRSVMAAALAMSAGGYPVVVDVVLGPWMLEVVRAELDGASVAADYVVLRPSLDVCLARACGRAGEIERVPGHPPLTDPGPVRQMWDQFADLGAAESHVIDSSDMDAEQTAARVRLERSTGRFRL